MATDRDRLDLLYDLAKRLGTAERPDELIAYATDRIRESFRAEGCSVLLLDRGGREFRFPVAAQGSDSPADPDTLRRIRFPADRGVAGWVLARGEGVFVPDTARDERFYHGVDDLTGTVTRSLLCVPLRTMAGVIGVVEVVNPVVGPVPEDDVAFLTAVASDVAAAYEKADLQRRVRREAAELRTLGFTVGVALVGLGLATAGVAAVGHLAHALPVAEVAVRPGVLGGIALAASGVVVLLFVRRAAARRRG